MTVSRGMLALAVGHEIHQASLPHAVIRCMRCDEHASSESVTQVLGVLC